MTKVYKPCLAFFISFSVTFCSLSKSLFPHFINSSTLTVCTRDVWNIEYLVNRILLFSQSVHAMYETMRDLNGVFYRSRSPYTRHTKPWQTWMASQSYFIVLTVRTYDVPNHDRLLLVWGSLRLASISVPCIGAYVLGHGVCLTIIINVRNISDEYDVHIVLWFMSILWASNTPLIGIGPVKIDHVSAKKSPIYSVFAVS